MNPEQAAADLDKRRQSLFSRTIQGARAAAKTVGSRLAKRAQGRPPSVQDLIEGHQNPSRAVRVEETLDGAKITLFPTYARLGKKFRELASQVDPEALLRTQLWVRIKKAPSRPAHLVTFSQAPRLLLWASRPDRGVQAVRRSLWTGDPRLSRKLLVDPVMERVAADGTLKAAATSAVRGGSP